MHDQIINNTIYKLEKDGNFRDRFNKVFYNKLGIGYFRLVYNDSFPPSYYTLCLELQQPDYYADDSFDLEDYPLSVQILFRITAYTINDNVSLEEIINRIL